METSLTDFMFHQSDFRGLNVSGLLSVSNPVKSSKSLALVLDWPAPSKGNIYI